ncbi:MAG: hypothetical protein KDD14_05770 [Saprospiraceae bacterium]|nr:hypothetical protein [Saprospiraceae bacterium]
MLRALTYCFGTWLLIVCYTAGLWAQSALPKLHPSNLSVFDIDKGLPISCANDGVIDPAGRLWINPCSNQNEHQTVNFYRFDGAQSVFIEWDGLPAGIKGQAALSGVARSGALFGYFRGTGTCFLFNPNTQKAHFHSLDTAGITIVFIGETEAYGIIMHALSPAEHQVYRLTEDSVQLLMAAPRLDAANPVFPLKISEYTLLTETDLWVLNVKPAERVQQVGRDHDLGALIQFRLKDRRIRSYSGEEYFQGAPPVLNRLNAFQIAAFGQRDSILIYSSAQDQFFCIDAQRETVRPFNPFQGIDPAQLISPYENQTFYKLANDHARNLLVYFNHRTICQAVLLDKKGKAFDYTPVLEAAKNKSRTPGANIHRIQSRDFLKQAFMFMAGGIAVVDLEFSGSINICMKGIPVRAMQEVSPGNYMTFPESKDQFFLFNPGTSTTAESYAPLPLDCLRSEARPTGPKHLVDIVKVNTDNFWVPFDNQLIRFRTDGSCTPYFVGKDFMKFAFLDTSTITLAADDQLFLYHIPSQKLRPLLINGNPIKFSGIVNQIYLAKDGILWVAALDGLHKIDLENNTYRLIGRSQGFMDNRMMCIEPDTDDRLWIGTYGGGLHIYDLQTETVSVVDQKRGLSNNIVVGILTDRAGVHWVSTYEGLNMVSAEGEVLCRLYQEDGLSTNEFNRYSYCKSSTGALLFGSIAGVNLIQPEALKAQLLEANPVRIFLTNLSYYDVTSDNLINKINWSYSVAPIKLSAEHRSISLQFALSSLVRSEENSFAYNLEGPNLEGLNTWIYIGTNKELNLQNLPAGAYRILVRGCDYRGNWTTDPLVIPIQAGEFFYKKSWFIVLCALSLAGLILAWVYRMQLKRKQLESELKERTDEIMRSRDQLVVQEKLASLGQLTAGIAHEIKNPLNFINNFALDSSKLADKVSAELKTLEGIVEPDTHKKFMRYLEDMKQNALDIKSSGSTADRIVRSMMDHARGTSEKMQMLDLNHLIEETLHLAVSGFRAKHPDFLIGLEETYDPNIRQLYGSPLNLSRAILNILNNACYALYEKQQDQAGHFQPKLHVNTQSSGAYAEIRIRDNGPGIDPEVQKNIFVPFFTTKPTGEGNTGLGLSICHDIIVNEHRGRLDINSEWGKFTEFLIKVPVDLATVS